MSVQSFNNVIALSRANLDVVIDAIQKFLETKTTKSILISGFAFIATTYILKAWLNQLREYKAANLSGPFPFPIFGNLVGLGRNGMNKFFRENVKKYGDTFIFFEGSNPIICTSDIEFIKQITIKDFRIFPMRKTFDAVDTLVPFDNMLTIVHTERWKNIRALITAGFTSGKLKNMTGSMLDTCDTFSAHLDSLVAKNLPFKNVLYSRFATDIVLSSFFGTNVNTINDPDHALPKAIRQLFGEEFLYNWRFALMLLFPKFAEFLIGNKMIDLVPGEASQYLIEFSNLIIEERRSGKTVRNDFLQHMVSHEETTSAETTVGDEMNSLKHLKKTLTNAEILSQSVLFMMVGSDTTATTLSWVSHNLTLNPDAQKKLIEEVDSVLVKYNGQITYEAMQDMHYMNAVIAETQRMYTVNFTDRQAVEDYEYKGIRVRKGQVMQLLLDVNTHDESVFPEPNKFMPERNRDVDQFIPFGSGQRVCVAQRFALLEIKLLLTTILKKFRFERCEGTEDKIDTDSSGLAKPAKPMTLKVVERTV